MNKGGDRQLKADLVLMGISQAEAAKKIGVSPAMVSAVLNGRKTSARVVGAIEEMLKDRAA